MSPTFSKAISCRFANLLKLNSFKGAFQRFWPQTQLDTLYNSYFEEHI